MTSSSGDTAIVRRRKSGLLRFENLPLALFFREFCKHPAMIGSIIPSSRKLIDGMLARIDWKATRLFVEYGPGIGTFTRHILDRMPPDATLVAIDTNGEFIRYLGETIADSRLLLVHGSAADLCEILAARNLAEPDYVLSGLPFSTLPDGVGPAIVRATKRALRPGGAFVTYQYSRRIHQLVAPEFTRIDSDFELMNIPPVHVYWSWKDEDAPLPTPG